MKKMSSKKTMSSKPTYKVGGSTKKPLKKAQSGGSNEWKPSYGYKDGLIKPGNPNYDVNYIGNRGTKPDRKPGVKDGKSDYSKDTNDYYISKMQSGGSTKSVSDMQQRGKESITKGTGKFTTGVQTYGPGYKGNPNSPKPFVGAAPAKKKGGAVKSKKK